MSILEALQREELPWTVAPWIEQAVGRGARLLSIDAVEGDSTANYAVQVRLPDGSTGRLMLRVYDDVKRLRSDPWYVPQQEALALRILAHANVPAPHLFAADFQRSACDVPALLESWLPGNASWNASHLDTYLERAAQTLVAIHGLRARGVAQLPRYAPYYRHDREEGFDRSPRLRRKIVKALRAMMAPAHSETLIHRDYHPGNILWDGFDVSGVVDWTTAARGPAGIDLARMRLNLAARHGRSVASRFVAAYVRAGGDAGARHPYWDLLDAADFLVDLSSEDSERGSPEASRVEEYVESVLAEC